MNFTFTIKPYIDETQFSLISCAFFQGYQGPEGPIGPSGEKVCTRTHSLYFSFIVTSGLLLKYVLFLILFAP